jgi:hypothetical protein
MISSTLAAGLPQLALASALPRLGGEPMGLPGAAGGAGGAGGGREDAFLGLIPPLRGAAGDVPLFPAYRGGEPSGAAREAGGKGSALLGEFTTTTRVQLPQARPEAPAAAPAAPEQPVPSSRWVAWRSAARGWEVGLSRVHSPRPSVYWVDVLRLAGRPGEGNRGWALTRPPAWPCPPVCADLRPRPTRTSARRRWCARHRTCSPSTPARWTRRRRPRACASWAATTGQRWAARAAVGVGMPGEPAGSTACGDEEQAWSDRPDSRGEEEEACRMAAQCA